MFNEFYKPVQEIFYSAIPNSLSGNERKNIKNQFRIKNETAYPEIYFWVLASKNMSFLEYFLKKNNACQRRKNFRHFVLEIKTDSKNKIL